MVAIWSFGYVEGTRRPSVVVEGWLVGGRCPWICQPCLDIYLWSTQDMRTAIEIQFIVCDSISYRPEIPSNRTDLGPQTTEHPAPLKFRPNSSTSSNSRTSENRNHPKKSSTCPLPLSLRHPTPLHPIFPSPLPPPSRPLVLSKNTKSQKKKKKSTHTPNNPSPNPNNPPFHGFTPHTTHHQRRPAPLATHQQTRTVFKPGFQRYQGLLEFG